MLIATKHSPVKEGYQATHLQVLLGSLLPLLGHSAGPDRACEHAGEGEESKGASNHGGGEVKDLATLIRRRRTAGAVGTESDVVGCTEQLWLADLPYRWCKMRSRVLRWMHRCHRLIWVHPAIIADILRLCVKLKSVVEEHCTHQPSSQLLSAISSRHASCP